MESIVGSFHGVASDKRLYRVCGYPQRMMRLVPVFVDIAFCLEYRDGLYSHNLIQTYICRIHKGKLQPILHIFKSVENNHKSQDCRLRNVVSRTKTISLESKEELKIC